MEVDDSLSKQRAFELARQANFGDEVFCPTCHSRDIQKRGTNTRGSQRYHCLYCGNFFSDLTGTPFAKRKIPVEVMTYIALNFEEMTESDIAEKFDLDPRVVRRFKEDIEWSDFLRKIRSVDR